MSTLSSNPVSCDSITYSTNIHGSEHSIGNCTTTRAPIIVKYKPHQQTHNQTSFPNDFGFSQFLIEALATGAVDGNLGTHE